MIIQNALAQLLRRFLILKGLLFFYGSVTLIVEVGSTLTIWLKYGKEVKMDLWVFDNDGTLYDDFRIGKKFMERLFNMFPDGKISQFNKLRRKICLK